MLQKFFGVKDLAVQAFNDPGVAGSPGGVIRAFADQANDGKSEIARHPEDYELYELGTFDTDSGRVAPLEEGPRLLARAVDLVRKV